MGETVVLEHIRSWETAGLIDERTAARLRAAEAMEATEAPAAAEAQTATAGPEAAAAVEAGAQVAGDGNGRPPRLGPVMSPQAWPWESVSLPKPPALLSPPAALTAGDLHLVAGADRPAPGLARRPGGLSAVEVLVYLGVALLVAAWYWELSARAPAFGSSRSWWFAAGTAIPAVLAAVAGIAARTRVDALGRAAGLLLLATGLQVAFVGYFLADLVRPGGDALDLTAGALLWAVVAAAFRRLEPGVPTAAGLVAAIVTVGGFAEAWLRGLIFGAMDWSGEMVGGLIAPGPLIPLLGAAWWLAVAAVIALVAEAEGRSVDEGGSWRGSVVRAVAGCTAVLGMAGSLLGTGWETGAGVVDRLDPFVGDVALLGLATGLVALAQATRAGAWLYPAALGVAIALSDLNAQYLADALGMAAALVAEGAILIALAAGTRVLRRRLPARAPVPSEAYPTETFVSPPGAGSSANRVS